MLIVIVCDPVTVGVNIKNTSFLVAPVIGVEDVKSPVTAAALTIKLIAPAQSSLTGGGGTTVPLAVIEVEAPPPLIEMVSVEYVAALNPAFKRIQTVLDANVPVPVYASVAEEPKPEVELVVDTSKFVEPDIVILPPPAVKLPALSVTEVALEGPLPCVYDMPLTEDTLGAI